MNIDVEKLSLEELIDLNRRVVHRIQYLASLKTHAQLARFDVGDRVTFQSDGRMIEGIVIRVNRKTLSIRTKDARWKIHPKFLTKRSSATSQLPQDIKTILEGGMSPFN